MSNLRQFKQNGPAVKAAYSAATTYYADDVVTYNNGVYICKVNGTLNVPPTVTANWDALLTPVMPTVGTTGTGTNPATFTLTMSGTQILLNRVS